MHWWAPTQKVVSFPVPLVVVVTLKIYFIVRMQPQQHCATFQCQVTTLFCSVNYPNCIKAIHDQTNTRDTSYGWLMSLCIARLLSSSYKRNKGPCSHFCDVCFPLSQLVVTQRELLMRSTDQQNPFPINLGSETRKNKQHLSPNLSAQRVGPQKQSLYPGLQKETGQLQVFWFQSWTPSTSWCLELSFQLYTNSSE